MKKLFLLILGLGIGIGIMSCSSEVTDEIIQSDEQVLAIQAVSSSMLLSYNEGTVEEMANGMNPTDFSEDDINDLDYYVEMIETFLGNDQLEVETTQSDNEDYEYMIVYTTLGISQEAMEFKLYYNVYTIDEPITDEPTTEDSVTDEPTTVAPATEPLAFNPDRQPSMRFEDEDDEFVEELIQGIMIIGDLTYEVEGKILNVNGKEITRIRSFIDEENFVLVNYQIDDTEVDKEKFFYQMVKDGQVVSRSKVMIFENDHMQHVQLEMIEGDEYARYQFHLRENSGVTYIHINYRIETNDEVSEGNIRLTKSIDPETNEVIYAYQVTPNQGQGQGGQFNKRHHHRSYMQENHQTTIL